MPVLLQQNDDGSGYLLRDVSDDQTVIHDLRPEGAQILLNVYGIKVGGSVDRETVEKLVGLRLATLRPVAVVEVEEPRPTPQARPSLPGRGPLSRASREQGRPTDTAPKQAPPRSNLVVEARTINLRNQRRTRGREVALQVLYQVEQNTGLPQAEVDQFIQRRLQEPRLCAFARALVAGVKTNQEKIDSLITDVAENWRLDRMAAIDRNILRLGAYEMLFDDGVPAKVAINEALELAKRYSTAQSSRFVNGILDRLLTTDLAGKTAQTTPGEPDVTVEPSPEPPPAEAPSAEA